MEILYYWFVYTNYRLQNVCLQAGIPETIFNPNSGIVNYFMVMHGCSITFSEDIEHPFHGVLKSYKR
jgi:rRNA maturation endonuclease Nob1